MVAYYALFSEHLAAIMILASISDVLMVPQVGLEPTTDRLWADSSNQLSYWGIWCTIRDLNPGPDGYGPSALTN